MHLLLMLFLAAVLAVILSRQAFATAKAKELSSPWAKARQKCNSKLKGEVRRQLRAILDLTEKVQRSITKSPDSELTTDSKLSEALIQVLEDSLDLALRWQEVESYLENLDPVRLRKDILATERGIDSSKDPLAKKTYVKVKKNLELRLKKLDELEGSRERVMAHFHRQKNRLEEMHMAIIQIQSKSAELYALSPAPLGNEIEDLTKDLHVELDTLEDFRKIAIEGAESSDEA